MYLIAWKKVYQNRTTGKVLNPKNIKQILYRLAVLWFAVARNYCSWSSCSSFSLSRTTAELGDNTNISCWSAVLFSVLTFMSWFSFYVVLVSFFLSLRDDNIFDNWEWALDVISQIQPSTWPLNVSHVTIRTIQQTRDNQPMIGYCWPNVFDVGPTITQHWINASCLLGAICFHSYWLQSPPHF